MPELMISSGHRQFCHRTADDVEKLIGRLGVYLHGCVDARCALLRPGPGETLDDRPPERQLFQRLAKHFCPLRPDSLIATSRTYPLRQQAELQMALDNLFGELIWDGFPVARAECQEDDTQAKQPH